MKEGREGGSPADDWGTSLLGGGNSKRKGPEAGCVQGVGGMARKPVDWGGGSEGEVTGDEVREVTGTIL